MPKMSEQGKQIKVWLPMHLLDGLRQDAKAGGERHIQSVIRHILGQYYRQQAKMAGVEVAIGGDGEERGDGKGYGEKA